MYLDDNGGLHLLIDIMSYSKSENLKQISEDQLITTENINAIDIAHYVKNCQPDFKIIVGNKQFEAHKLLLSVKSSYFRALFASGMKDSNTVTIPDISPLIWKEIQSYVYNKKCSVNRANIAEFLYASDKYDFEGLKWQCVELLKSWLDVENMGVIFGLAEKYSLPKLRAEVLQFIARNFAAILPKKEFVQLCKEHPNIFEEIHSIAFIK